MRSSACTRLHAVARVCLVFVAISPMTRANGQDRVAPVVSPYGSWESPLRAEVLSSGRVAMSDLRSVDGRLYWTETMPLAGGISGLFQCRGRGEWNTGQS